LQCILNLSLPSWNVGVVCPLWWTRYLQEFCLEPEKTKASMFSLVLPDRYLFSISYLITLTLECDLGACLPSRFYINGQNFLLLSDWIVIFNNTAGNFHSFCNTLWSCSSSINIKLFYHDFKRLFFSLQTIIPHPTWNYHENEAWNLNLCFRQTKFEKWNPASVWGQNQFCLTNLK